MTFEDCRPIVEAKLMVWGAMRNIHVPVPSISNAYQPFTSTTRNDGPSVEESWVIKFEKELTIVREVEKAVSKLSEEQRWLLEFRYGQRMNWEQVAQRLYISRREVFIMRDRVLCCMAYGLGLLDEKVCT